jgi:hypothetical protein
MILGRHFEQLEFLDILLGDRPALQPDESFYQRMLAGDPDDAREQAEQFLKEAPLTRYYDEVVVPGLRRATIDAARGTLDAAESVHVLEAAYALIEDLAEEAKPDASSAEAWPANHGNVLCVAGRGPMDEAAARMLSQLLGERGIAAYAVPYRAVSRSELATLQARGAAMLCLCYLDLEGGISHVRYLLRRLRRVLPDLPMLVGIWPSNAPALQDERIRVAIGANHYATSLQEAVEACAGVVRQSGRTPQPQPA